MVDPVTLGIGALGVGMNYLGAGRAQREQERANRQMMEFLERQWQASEGYRNLGQQGIAGLAGLQSNPNSLTGMPGYQFRLNEGSRALARQGAATGGSLSGRQMMAAQRYGQGMAADEYNNAFNRLMSMAGVGLRGVGMGNASLGAQAAGASQLGDIQAMGTQGRTDALMGGLRDGLGAYLFDDTADPAQSSPLDMMNHGGIPGPTAGPGAVGYVGDGIMEIDITGFNPAAPSPSVSVATPGFMDFLRRLG